MSAEAGSSGVTWKVSLPCTRAEAELLNDDVPALALLSSTPTLMTSEADAKRPDEWRLDAYFEERPSARDLELIAKLVPGARSVKPEVTRVEVEDWVTVSQQGLEPITAGRFFIHTPAHRGSAPDRAISFEVEAGRAFGTGHHETTAGCLEMLDRLKRRGASFSNILDLGTGTGLLAFAALALWPTARVTASDIDPVAIDVARENAHVNNVRLGPGRGKLELATASGLDHRRLKSRAPFDLVIANILAAPLIALAPAIAQSLAQRGRVLLAGLLSEQADRVARAYRRENIVVADRIHRNDWPSLLLRKRPRP